MQPDLTLSPVIAITYDGTRGGLRALFFKNLALFLDKAVGPQLGVFADGIDMAQWLVNQSHSCDAEREADRLGVALLNQAGISTEGFAASFERQAAVTAPGAAQTKPALTEEEWRALKNICVVRRKT